MKILGAFPPMSLTIAYIPFYYSLPLTSVFKAVNSVASLAFDIYLAL